MFKTDEAKIKATKNSLIFLIYFIIAGLIGFAPLKGINFFGALVCIITIIYCAPTRDDDEHHNLTT